MTVKVGSEKYPLIDRSHCHVDRTKNDSGVLDIGWAEGMLTGGRPYRMELWAQDQVTVLTVFFSADGIEEANGTILLKFLEASGLISFSNRIAPTGMAMILDRAGNRFWSVNIVVGDEECTYIESSTIIQPYRQSVLAEA